MEKIIEGKKYNTETATKIGGYWNGLGGNDFRNVSEDLYKTKKGNYFVSGSGGPMSKYAVSNGNTTSGGDDITPLSKDGAFAWAQNHLDSEITGKEFSDLIEEA
jgi:hypothetical protein